MRIRTPAYPGSAASEAPSCGCARGVSDEVGKGGAAGGKTRLDAVAGGELVLARERPGHHLHSGLERQAEFGELVREPGDGGGGRSEHLAAHRPLAVRS